jgi:hypothetical protein
MFEVQPFGEIETARLVLRPTAVADAGRFHSIQSNRNVTRMLSMATFPQHSTREQIAIYLTSALSDRHGLKSRSKIAI